jgi:hypothetical protein
MNKKYPILIYILALFLISISASLAIDIPEALRKNGFSEENLISYDKEGSEEFFTFWLNKENGDTVTFIVENGKVKQTSEGEPVKFLSK